MQGLELGGGADVEDHQVLGLGDPLTQGVGSSVVMAVEAEVMDILPECSLGQVVIPVLPIPYGVYKRPQGV